MEFLTHCPSSRSQGPLQSRAWEVLSWVWERKVFLVQCALALNGDPWKPRRHPQSPRPIVEPSLPCSPRSSAFLLLSISQTCAALQVCVLLKV